MTKAEELALLHGIVRDLAACEDTTDYDSLECALCGGEAVTEDDGDHYTHYHAEECPWRRAVDYVKGDKG